ncbi:MAG: sulfite exporter TauE/SafE family protein [Cucumibacter sp.]
MSVDPVFVLVAAGAVFIVALAKSGLLSSLGLLGVPLLTLVMGAREAAALMLPLLLVMDAIALIAWRREVSWRNLAILFPGALLGTGAGWLFWAVTSENAVRLLIGIISLVFVLDAWLPLRQKLAAVKPSTPWGIVCGTLAGFTSFVSHTGGPPFQIFVLPQRLSPAVYAGTTAVFFAALNGAKVFPYLSLGQLNAEILRLALWFFPVAIAGMLIGIWAMRRISTEFFYRLAYVLVFLLGLKLVWDGAAGLWLPA